MSFKDDFAKFPPGSQREQLVYRALISQGKPTDLWSMTVNGPNGSKIIYKITRDFLNVDGFYVPMTGTTAQKVADYFGMYLPSNTIADQVWKAAQGKITVYPLSGTGYQGTDRFYSPQEVVNSRISATDAAIAFNDKISQEKSKNPNGSKNQLMDIGSGAKWLTVPPASGSLGLHGIRTPDGGTAQGGYGTSHSNYESHTEYGTFVRLIDNMITIIYSDGRKETLPMTEFIKRPEHSALYVEGQDIRNGELSQYDLKRDKAQLSKIDTEIGPSKGENQMAQNQFSNEEIDKFLTELNQQVSSAGLFDKLIKKYSVSSNIQIMNSIGKDPAIKNLSGNSIPGHPPEGFMVLPAKEKSQEIGQAATQILKSFQLGDQVPFKIGDQLYLGRSEPHFHPHPPNGTPINEQGKYPKPWGWHQGVTVFKAKEGTNEDNLSPSKSQTRMKLLQRMQGEMPEQEIDNFLTELQSEF